MQAEDRPDPIKFRCAWSGTAMEKVLEYRVLPAYSRTVTESDLKVMMMTGPSRMRTYYGAGEMMIELYRNHSSTGRRRLRGGCSHACLLWPSASLISLRYRTNQNPLSAVLILRPGFAATRLLQTSMVIHYAWIVGNNEAPLRWGRKKKSPSEEYQQMH